MEFPFTVSSHKISSVHVRTDQVTEQRVDRKEMPVNTDNSSRPEDGEQHGVVVYMTESEWVDFERDDDAT